MGLQYWKQTLPFTKSNLLPAPHLTLSLILKKREYFFFLIDLWCPNWGNITSKFQIPSLNCEGVGAQQRFKRKSTFLVGKWNNHNAVCRTPAQKWNIILTSQNLKFWQNPNSEKTPKLKLWQKLKLKLRQN